MTHFCFSKIVLLFCLALLFPQSSFFAGQDVPVTPAEKNTSEPLQTESEPIEPLQIALSVNEVRLDVVVLDRNGNPVTDLTAKDFEVFQNGARQNVLSSVYIDNQSNAASKPSPAPQNTRILSQTPATDLKREDTRRTILFVVDDLSMSFENGYHAKMALRNYVEKQMQPGDMMAILRTGYGNSALQFFLSDKNQALERINSMRMERTLSPNLDGSHLYRIYDNQLSTLSYSLRALSDMPGRKILVMMTAAPKLSKPITPTIPVLNINMIDFHSLYNERFSRLADDALRAGVVVNFLNIRGLLVEPNLTTEEQRNVDMLNDAKIHALDSEKMILLMLIEKIFNESRGFSPVNALNPLPIKTGGVTVENSNFFLDGIGRETENLMRGYYLISYEPPSNTFNPDGKEIFNQIKVNVNRGNVRVYTRDGFYNKLESETTAAAASANPLRDAIFSPFLHADLDVNMAAGYVKDAKAGYLVRAWVHIDPNDMKIVETEDGIARIDIEAFCVTSDINGFVQDSRRIYFTLSNIRTAEDIAKIRKHGIRFAMLLPVKKPGFYYVRIAVEDTESGKIGSAYQFVEIPDLDKRGLALSSVFMITGDEDLKWMHSDAITEIDEGVVFIPAQQGEEARSPALRTYESGDSLQILTMLYNADEKAIAGAEIEMQYILYRDGVEFLRSEPRPVSPPDNAEKLEGIPLSQKFTMGKDMPPGDYVFQLQVTDNRNSRRREGSASQVISFTVVDDPSPERLAALRITPGAANNGEGVNNPSPEQLAARHLESIGGLTALSQIKSIAFTGTSEFQFTQGWSGADTGTAILVSEGPKMAMVMEFSSINYSGEYFAYDGKTVTMGQSAPDLKSPIADFLQLYDKIMKNGLLGGVYSNAWPLLNIGGKNAGMEVGKVRVEGTELYELVYVPNDNHSEMKICLYFDPETWRHVRTDYYLSTYRGFNANPTLTEKFEEFRKVGNLTMPYRYTLHLEDWKGHIASWKIEVSVWIFNRPDIDQRIFQTGN